MQFDAEYIAIKTATENLSNRIEKAKQELAYAQKYIRAKDEIEKLFDKAEYRLRGSEIDTISRILTAILNDTLYAGTNDERKVGMRYAVQRNLPSLDIYIENNGFEESIMHGQGGAVANAVSTGLRIFTIVRAKRLDKTIRNFIILDESDCWIKPEFVSRFSEAISSVAEKIGMQVLYISHHDPSYLAIDNIVHLYKDRHGIVRTEYKDFPKGSISYIRLKNFMSHLDTYIPLSQGVTLLAGENNLGKSAVAVAFRSLAYGEMRKSFVRHGTNESTIEIGVDGKRIVYTYKIKGNSTQASWQLFDENDNEILHTNQKQTPEEITNLLGIKEIEGMDVQIGDQKTPVFLINQGPSVRAKILNIGSETKHLERIMELWKEKLKTAKQKQRESEKIVSLGTSVLAQIEKLGLDERYKKLTELNAKIIKQKEQLDNLSSLIRQIERLSRTIKPLSEIKGLKQPKTPQLKDAEGLIRFIKMMSANRAIIENLSFLKEIKQPIVPTIDSLEQLLQMGKRLSHTAKILNALAVLKNTKVPALPSLKSDEHLNRIFIAHKTLKAQEAATEKAKEKLTKSERHIKDMFLKLGYCPLCGRKVEDEKDLTTHFKTEVLYG